MSRLASPQDKPVEDAYIGRIGVTHPTFLVVLLNNTIGNNYTLSTSQLDWNLIVDIQPKPQVVLTNG